MITLAREEADLRDRVDLSRLPAHVAVIMDGNGRWARHRGLPRIEGHRRGRRAVRSVVEACRDLGVGVLTLYTFSTENWRRPQAEVSGLMTLIEIVARQELADLCKNNVRVQVIGRMEELPGSLQKQLRDDMDRTRENTGMTLNLAINYGSRTELVDAIKAIVRSGITDECVNEEFVSSQLYTRGQPDVDLLVRTASEWRLSNFLLWQCAYAEIYVTDVLWPDFGKGDLFKALLHYQNRDRKFGGVG